MNLDRSSELLVTRAKEGSIEAVSTLLDNYKQNIYVIAFALLNDQSKSLEAERDSMIHVWKNIGLTNEADFENWLYRAAYTVSDEKLDPAERTSSNDDTEKLISRDTAVNVLMMPELYASRNVLKERLISIIFALPPVLRETLVLYYYHKKSPAETGIIMGCPESKALSRLYQAHESISASLEEQEKEKDEHFFGKLKGSVSLGAFISYHIGRNLPTQPEFAKILEESRASAYQAVKTYPEPTAPAPQAPPVPQAPPAPPVPPAPPAPQAPPAPNIPPKPPVPQAVRPPKSAEPEAPPIPRQAQQSAPPSPPSGAPLSRPARSSGERPSAPRTPRSTPARPEQPTEKKSSSKAPGIVMALFVAAGVAAVLAVLLFIGYKHFQNKTDEAPTISVSTETQENNAIPIPADATAAPTEETSKISAYSAYLDILKENDEAIRDYDWQYDDESSKPVVFADVMGDETDELIYIRAESDGGKDKKPCSLHIVTFDGEKAVEACKFEIEYKTAIYCLTQLDDSKNLYLFFVSSSDRTSNSETAYWFIENGENTLEARKRIVYTPSSKKGTADGNEVSSEEARAAFLDLAERSSKLLMSTSVTDDILYQDALGIEAENQAMTLDSALSFLNSKVFET